MIAICVLVGEVIQYLKLTFNVIPKTCLKIKY